MYSVHMILSASKKQPTIYFFPIYFHYKLFWSHRKYECTHPNFKRRCYYWKGAFSFVQNKNEIEASEVFKNIWCYISVCISHGGFQLFLFENCSSNVVVHYIQKKNTIRTNLLGQYKSVHRMGLKWTFFEMLSWILRKIYAYVLKYYVHYLESLAQKCTDPHPPWRLPQE